MISKCPRRRLAVAGALRSLVGIEVLGDEGEKGDNNQMGMKIMSLFYAGKSDEVGCALRVIVHTKRDVRCLDSRSYACMRVYVHI